MAFSFRDYQESNLVSDARKKKDQYSTYNESDLVKQYRDALTKHEANKLADWTGGQYGNQMNEALNKILNRDKFSYDLNGDALYQQYKDQYTRLGKMAMLDTTGQASAMTGGYGNSYAATAGNQAYQGYLQNLNDVVPELYQMAMDKYNMEGQDLQNQYAMLADRYNTDYGMYRDKVSDWNTERDYLNTKYNNERNVDYSRFSDNRDYYTNAYNNERTYDYGQYSDAYNRAFGQYQQQVSEDQFEKKQALERDRLDATIIANDQSETIKSLKEQLAKISTGGGADGEGLKVPTDEMFEGAAEAYSTSGEDGLNAFIQKYPQYDTDQLFAYIRDNNIQLPQTMRTYTKVKDTFNGGFNWFGQWNVDNNDIVQDQYGNEYRIDALPKSMQMALTKLKKGEVWKPKK